MFSFSKSFDAFDQSRPGSECVIYLLCFFLIEQRRAEKPLSTRQVSNIISLYQKDTYVRKKEHDTWMERIIEFVLNLI